MPTNLTLLRYVFFGIIVNNTNSLVQGRQRYTVTGVVRFLPERLGARVAPGSWSHPADDSPTQRATPASGALTLYVCLARYGIGECVERCEKSKRIIAIKVATVISAVVRGAVKQQCQVADRWCQQRNLRIRERGQSIQLGGFELAAMGNASSAPQGLFRRCGQRWCQRSSVIPIVIPWTQKSVSRSVNCGSPEPNSGLSWNCEELTFRSMESVAVTTSDQ